MKTIEIKLFQFNELTDEAKKKALEKMYDININYDWYDFTYEDFKNEVAKEYFEVEKIYFSGFSSQGDGAMFEYSGITDKLFNEAVDSLELPQWKKRVLKHEGLHSCSGKHRGHYHHEKCCDHRLYFEPNDSSYENINALLYDHHQELEDYVTEKYEELAQELYRSLEKEYDYYTSDEAIQETIEANEYDFTEEGEQY